MTTGRFAPSPSGDLHLGNLRTALLAWCFARHSGGRFLIRVEDLTTGAEPRRTTEMLEDLAAVGIDHDPPIVFQSERRIRYDEVVDRLTEAGLTYPCYCSRRDIREAASAPHGPPIEGGYPGTCRDLSDSELAERRSHGRPPALRMRAGNATVAVSDRLLGPIGGPVDDFVVRRADGVAAYNLAVVVDDADQGIDQVVRGDDLVETTARQVLLQHVLDLATPEYVHVPLVLGPDGERLAKRHGAVTLREQIAAGRTSAQVVGALAASCGLGSPDEALDAATVLSRFDPDALEISSRVPD
ncbi:MAG: tRNA glutamyl-Q(34) synthetase GluQRS [Microthrixaceae bacterium]